MGERKQFCLFGLTDGSYAWFPNACFNHDTNHLNYENRVLA
jgi:hypothetical protein